MNPTVTGGLTLAGSQVGPVVQYFFQIIHVAPPSDNVAALIGVGLLTGTHALWVFVNNRLPVKAPLVVTSAVARNASAAQAPVQ
jgi:hypothetical protein